MKVTKLFAAIVASGTLLAAWGTASAVSLELMADNWQGDSSTLGMAFKTCPPAIGNGCIDPTNPWVVSNGVTGSTATWTWNGTTLAATGTYQTTGFLDSDPFGPVVTSDKIVDLKITPSTQTTTAATYNCVNGDYLFGLHIDGCMSTWFGRNSISESSIMYNLYGDATCMDRTIEGDDIGAVEDLLGLTTTVGVGSCNTTQGRYDLWTILTDTTGSGPGGQLILSNGIPLTDDGAHYMTFAAVVPIPATIWMLGSALGLLGLSRRWAATG